MTSLCLTQIIRLQQRLLLVWGLTQMLTHSVPAALLCRAQHALHRPTVGTRTSMGMWGSTHLRQGSILTKPLWALTHLSQCVEARGRLPCKEQGPKHRTSLLKLSQAGIK